LKILIVSNNKLSGIIPNLTWSNFELIRLASNCGLVAYDNSQAAILNNKNNGWQVLANNCQ